MRKSKESLPPLYFGCPMWTHSNWKKNWFGHAAAGLTDYAQQCNSVEGNTTFYQIPDNSRAETWRESVPENFRFCFKLPQTITHEQKLIDSDGALQRFWSALSPLHDRIGVLIAQLPESFGPNQLHTLTHFIQQYSLPVPLAVEVRHPEFFAKGHAEKALNQLLIKYAVNRVIMDTRALFATEPKTALERDVQQKKPKVPVNVLASAQHPVVRFVGGNDETINEQKLSPWIKKCHQWRLDGKSPFIFIHSPDNGNAPWLLQKFITMYNETNEQGQLDRLSLRNDPIDDPQRALF